MKIKFPPLHVMPDFPYKLGDRVKGTNIQVSWFMYENGVLELHLEMDIENDRTKSDSE